MGTKEETIDPTAVTTLGERKTPAAGFFERLPEWVIDTLSTEQKEAIHQAVEDPAWKRSPVDIRFTIPFFGKKF